MSTPRLTDSYPDQLLDSEWFWVKSSPGDGWMVSLTDSNNGGFGMNIDNIFWHRFRASLNKLRKSIRQRDDHGPCRLCIGGWWVSYLWQGKVHIQVLFMMGLLDMKMDCIKSLQSVPLYYCLLYIWYASKLMTGVLENAATFWFRISYGIHEFAQGLTL